jgi:O-antigen/teichoic acid export membrane protein
LLRARGSYAGAAVLSKSASAVFLVAALAVLYGLGLRQLSAILPVYAAIVVAACLAGAWRVRRLASGAAPVPAQAVREGFWLFLISVSFVALVQLDQFFIVRMLGYEALAGYAAVATVTRGFEIISMALWLVLTPEYSRTRRRSIASDALKVGGIATLAAAAYAAAGRPLLHLFFAGRFDHAGALMGAFIVIGCLRILHTVPSGIIDGRLTGRGLRVFLASSVLGIAVTAGGHLLLIPRWGLLGAVYATMASWAFRVCIAYLMAWHEERLGGRLAANA